MKGLSPFIDLHEDKIAEQALWAFGFGGLYVCATFLHSWHFSLSWCHHNMDKGKYAKGSFGFKHTLDHGWSLFTIQWHISSVVQTSVAWWWYVDVWCMVFFGKHHGYLMIYVAMKHCVCKDHITLQLEFKTTQAQLCCNYILQSATPMQLHFINIVI